MILAIETSTTFASVALVREDGVCALAESEARTHSEKLIALVDQVLTQTKTSIDKIDGVAIGVGPGSFTGLRIGMATAKGLCFAAGKPMWAVSSLAALALEAADVEKTALLIPVLDARRKEVFLGFYDRSSQGDDPTALIPSSPELVLPPAAVAQAVSDVADGRPVMLFGEGAVLYRERLESDGLEVDKQGPLRPSAVFVGKLAARAEPESNMAQLAPVYIRKSEAEIRYPDGNPGGSYAPLKATSKKR